MKEKQKQLKKIHDQRNYLLKECIRILNSKGTKVIRIQRYFEFVETFDILNQELKDHMLSLRKISVHEFSFKKETSFLKSLLKK